MDGSGPKPECSRREFLGLGTGGAAAAWMATQWPALLALGHSAAEAREAGAPFVNLEPATARALEAVAAQIIPTTDTPGAREAGVIWFIDGALGSWIPVGPMLTTAMQELDEAAGEGGFAALDDAAQIEMLGRFDSASWFGLVRMLTVAGMFAMPAHGGNRGHVGWDLIGFDHRHAWAPPFGHYDAHPDAAEDDDASG